MQRLTDRECDPTDPFTILDPEIDELYATQKPLSVDFEAQKAREGRLEKGKR